MLSEQEALQRMKANNIPVDSLLLHRWMKQRKLPMIRIQGQDGWHITEDALTPFIRNWLLEENGRLKKERETYMKEIAELKKKLEDSTFPF